jgi:hypothetical protein
MSFYAIDADQKFCRAGKCLDPVQPIPGLAQCTANPLHAKVEQPTTGHQVPSNRGSTCSCGKPFPGMTISTSAPLSLGKEPKPANVLMAGVVLAVVLLLTTTTPNWQSVLSRVVLFMSLWHGLRVAFPRYY